MSKEEPDSSIEKKLKQAKRNSILNSSNTHLQVQLKRQETASSIRKEVNKEVAGGSGGNIEATMILNTPSNYQNINSTEIDFQDKDQSEERKTRSKENINIKVINVESKKSQQSTFRENSPRASNEERKSSFGSNQRKDSDKFSSQVNQKLSTQTVKIEPNIFLGQISTDINEIVKGLISDTQEQMQKQSITNSLLNRQQSLAKERQERSSQPLILQMRQKTLKKNGNESSDPGSGQSLMHRKSKMRNLRPLDTLNENAVNLNQMRTSISPANTSAGVNINQLKVKSNSNNNSLGANSPFSGGSMTPTTKRKLLPAEYSQQKKKETIEKFQQAVWHALQQSRDQQKGVGSFGSNGQIGQGIAFSQSQRDEFGSNRFESLTSMNRTDTVFSQNQYFLSRPDQNNNNLLPIPMTPMLRRNKMSFFDVVKSLNPFKKSSNNLDNKVGDLNTEIDLFRANQFTETVTQAEERKKRAQYLWKKAKSVFKAISIWKRIQTEIQMYGTHNYEFRKNFKVTQNKTLLTKTTSIRSDTINGIMSNKFQSYIHPDSKFKKIWTFFVIIFLIYAGTLMPYKLAFLDFQYGDAWFFLDILADLCFFIDVFVNSISAYYDEEGTLIRNNRIIFIRYLKSWFFWDLLASFPITFLEARDRKASWQVITNANQLIRLFRLPRLYAIVKFTRVSKIFGSLKKNKILIMIQEFIQLNVGVWRLISFALTGIICIHVSACFWFLSSKIADFDPTTWVVRSGFVDDDQGRKYLASVYWSISTVLTVGYGDLHAQTNAERLISVAWMMIGVIFYSVTIGLISAILGKIDSRSSQLKSKLEIIEQFCAEAQVSIVLKRKIKEALEYHSNRNAFSYIENNSILSEIPTHLKSEIALQIHSGKIGRLPFFQNKDQSFIGSIVPLLQPLRVVANDYIFMKDDHPYEIYFIVDGRVQLIMGSSECVFKSWPQGAYFGEIEIIFQKKRICTAKAEQDCDLFTLNKKYYQTTIFNDYPEIDRQLRELALEREAKINHTLDKARLVLESIGIRDALQLPLRQKRGSMNSQVTAKKRREAFKNTALKKVAKSFDEAHRSFSLSEVSAQKSNQTIKNNNGSVSMMNVIDKSSPSKDKDREDESSSSGDFNIWGDQKSESDDKESIKTDKSMKNQEKISPSQQSQKSSQSKSPTKAGNFDRFKAIFDQQKQRQMNLKKISTIQSEIEDSSSDQSSNGSKNNNEKKSSVSDEKTKISLAKQNAQLNKQQTRFVKGQQQSSSSEEIKSSKSKDSFQTSKSLKNDESLSEDGQKRLSDTSIPKINIIKTNDSRMEQKLSEPFQDNYLSPFQTENAKEKIDHLQNFSNFMSNDELVKSLQSGTKHSKEPDQVVSLIKKQNTGEKQFHLKVEKALEDHDSPSAIKLSQKMKMKTNHQIEENSVSSSENLSKKKLKKSTHSLSSFKSTGKNTSKNRSKQDRLNRSYNKLHELALSPISHRQSTKKYLEDMRELSLDAEVFQIIIPYQQDRLAEGSPKKSIKSQTQQKLAYQFQDLNQQRQLKEMSHQLKRVKGHFQENSNQYENMEFKVQTLQTSMDLMAKMLKDIGQKQLKKQFQSHREDIKRNKIEPSAGSQSSKTQTNINIEDISNQNINQRKFKRDVAPRIDKYKTKMQQYNDSNAEQFNKRYFKNSQNYNRNSGQSGLGLNRAGAGSITSSTDWMKNSFTLDSHDSLIPIKRMENQQSKLMSTTVDDHAFLLQ